MYASAMGASGTLDELLRRGGNPNSVTARGTTALMVAAAKGQAAALSVLLAQRRIDVDATTPREFHAPQFALYSEEERPTWTGHRTALMYAVKGGYADSVRLLLQHGASPGQKDAEGWTALRYARSPEVRRLLGGPP
jgi:ankyrin repeat protein